MSGDNSFFGGYTPEEVGKLCEEILNELTETIVEDESIRENILSITLIGSTARKEFNKKLQDLDYIIVYKNVPSDSFFDKLGSIFMLFDKIVKESHDIMFDWMPQFSVWKPRINPEKYTVGLQVLLLSKRRLWRLVYAYPHFGHTMYYMSRKLYGYEMKSIYPLPPYNRAHALTLYYALIWLYKIFLDSLVAFYNKDEEKLFDYIQYSSLFAVIHVLMLSGIIPPTKFKAIQIFKERINRRYGLLVEDIYKRKHNYDFRIEDNEIVSLMEFFKIILEKLGLLKVKSIKSKEIEFITLEDFVTSKKLEFIVAEDIDSMKEIEDIQSIYTRSDMHYDYIRNAIYEILGLKKRKSDFVHSVFTLAIFRHLANSQDYILETSKLKDVIEQKYELKIRHLSVIDGFLSMERGLLSLEQYIDEIATIKNRFKFDRQTLLNFLAFIVNLAADTISTSLGKEVYNPNDAIENLKNILQVDDIYSQILKSSSLVKNIRRFIDLIIEKAIP